MPCTICPTNQSNIKNPMQGFIVVYNKMALPFIKSKYECILLVSQFLLSQNMILKYMDLFHLNLIQPLFKIKVYGKDPTASLQDIFKDFFISVLSPSSFSPPMVKYIPLTTYCLLRLKSLDQFTENKDIEAVTSHRDCLQAQ